MSLIVFTDGPIGPTSAPVKHDADVDIYVAALRAKGHYNIRVSSAGQRAQPYDEWQAARNARRVLEQPAFPKR